MSDSNSGKLHDSPRLPIEHDDDVFQQHSTFGDDMLVDGQTPVEQPSELHDRGGQQDILFEDVMPFTEEMFLERPTYLLDDSVQQNFMWNNAMPLDDQPSGEQAPELYGNVNAQQDSSMDIDDKPSFGQLPKTYDYDTFDPEKFLHDIAEIESNPQAWWAQGGGPLRSDGLIDFGFSPDGPDFNFDTSSIPHTAQTSLPEPINTLGLAGLPLVLNTTPTSGQPQQVSAQPDVGLNCYPQHPPVLHSLPYSFNWDEITQRQLELLRRNGSGQFVTNSGTGTVLEAIPENEARTPGLSTPPPKQPSNFDYLETAAKTLTTPSPSPILQAASVKRQPGDRRHTIVTGRNQPAVKFTIYQETLLVNSVAEAKQTAITHIPLDIPKGHDDRDAVASQPQFWIPRITRAFDSDFLVQPDDGTKLTAEGQTEWTRWQSEHENKVWSILALHADPKRLAQSCAWIFYNLVLRAHEKDQGLPAVGKTIANPGPNTRLICSERINQAITVLEKFPIVRYDFLKQDRLDGLAANPGGFVSRKIDNMWVNYKKKHKTGPVKEESVKTEPATKKRKASEAEQQSDANGQPAGDVDPKQSKRKKVKATPKKRGSQAKPKQVKDEDGDEIM